MTERIATASLHKGSRSIRPCTGCKHLVHARGADVCKAKDAAPSARSINPYTGRSETIIGGFRPTVVMMRSADGDCGPDAFLYQPNWWRRLTGER